MEIQKDSAASENMEAAAHTLNHIFSYINSMSLKCAVELGIPEIVHNHGKPMLLSELIHELPINPPKAPNIYRLMRILIHSGFFVAEKTAENDEQEGFVLTPPCELLLKDHPMSLCQYVLAQLDPMLTSPFDHLAEWFQNEDPCPFTTAHGESLWEKAGKDSRLNSLFNKAMASSSRLVTSPLTKKCRAVFEGIDSMVDVAGGTGTMAKSIVDAFPHIKVSVFDLPHVVDGLKGGDNLTYVGGDMFESIPSADAVFLKYILHDWSDEECIEILKNCKEAISSNKKGGKVIIIDMVLDDKQGSQEVIETQLFYDMLMMGHTEGKERTEKEWAKLFTEVGFSRYKIYFQALGLRSLIELFY